MMTTRFVQKVVVLTILLTCTSLLYLNQASTPFRSRSLPQNVGAHHYTKIAREYSVKPLAYIFPQYYTFADNDRLHGLNFTEWVNVQKVTHNGYGLETIRPHESIGFYNGLTLETRKRYGDFLKGYGFHGAVFHHYWFAGRPVMDHVIQEMLKDGEPNVPFMLSWANEPWSARWDGMDGSGVLIAQEYGLHEAWRKHFDWLLPFFKHPSYIRSEGKVQFVVYNPGHVAHLGPHMWAAFRQWAVEEGLGGMDIIETRWGDDGADSWKGHPPDAVNEFHPHVAGRDPTMFPAIRRLSRVYHRGTLACWDTTPRHPTDFKAVAEPFCHPKTFKWQLVEMLRKIKSDPNPIGAENFLFVNALNEWGEGNSLEPSQQFGDGYGVAMREAMEISDKEHVWFDIQTEDSLARDKEISATVMNATADVCVLVRTSLEDAEHGEYKLTAMLRSLIAQRNQNWRAVVVQTDKREFWGLDQLVLQTLDSRIRYQTTPPEESHILEVNDDGWTATDWFVKNLKKSDAGCANAGYILITDGKNTYEPDAFSAASQTWGDMIGLNVESRQTQWDHPMLQNVTWNETCTRLENPSLNFCNTSTPTLTGFDLSATFLKLSKLRGEYHSFSTIPCKRGHEAGTLAEFLFKERGWSFTAAAADKPTCHVHHNPSYASCLRSGNFWFDSPDFDEQGCYSSQHFMDTYAPDEETKYMKDFDLQFFREHGNCIRYKESAYNDLVRSTQISTQPATQSQSSEGIKQLPKPTGSESQVSKEQTNEKQQQETKKPPPQPSENRPDDKIENASDQNSDEKVLPPPSSSGTEHRKVDPIPESEPADKAPHLTELKLMEAVREAAKEAAKEKEKEKGKEDGGREAAKEFKPAPPPSSATQEKSEDVAPAQAKGNDGGNL